MKERTFKACCDICLKYKVTPAGSPSQSVFVTQLLETSECVEDLVFHLETDEEIGKAIHYYHLGFGRGRDWGIWAGRIELQEEFAKLMSLEPYKPF